VQACLVEERSAGGAVRYVESSIERVKAWGMAPDRQVLAGKGIPVSLPSRCLR
jgi:uncharacterized protein (DUF2126 family)